SWPAPGPACASRSGRSRRSPTASCSVPASGRPRWSWGPGGCAPNPQRGATRSGAIARRLAGGGTGRPIGRAVLAAGLAHPLYPLVVGVQELGRLDWGRYLQATLAGFALYPLSLLCQALAWALALGLARRNRLHADWRDVRIYASSHLVRRLP